MASMGVRRLPVVDGERHLVGLLSLSDAASAVSSGDGPRPTAVVAELCRALARGSQRRSAPVSDAGAELRVRFT